jgi:iron complex transport system permease protein
MSCEPKFVSPRLMLPALLLALAVVAMAALLVGSVSLSPGEVLRQLWGAAIGWAEPGISGRILLTTRLPRVLLAIAVGGAMGMSGLASQTLFRNPLASPYVMGVSNGAAVGAVVGMLLVGKVIGFASVPIFSVTAGLAVTAGVFMLAWRGGNFGQSLLLAGIAVSAFCSALTAGALFLAGERLGTIVFWLMGGLWQSTWRDVLIMMPAGLACFVILTILAPAMNAALLGERSAGDLGVNVRRLQNWLLVIVAVATSLAVSMTGVIGFVGLIVPHLLRLAIGSDHRGLLPASALGGAILLLIADTLARTIAGPAEVPVGILTALVGAPIFLWLLQHQSARRPAK